MNSEEVNYSKKERAVQRALGTWSSYKEFVYAHRIKTRILRIWGILIAIYLVGIICGTIWNLPWKDSPLLPIGMGLLQGLYIFTQISTWFQNKFIGPPFTKEECNEVQ